jgi:hypothetical protein
MSNEMVPLITAVVDKASFTFSTTANKIITKGARYIATVAKDGLNTTTATKGSAGNRNGSGRGNGKNEKGNGSFSFASFAFASVSLLFLQVSWIVLDDGAS